MLVDGAMPRTQRHASGIWGLERSGGEGVVSSSARGRRSNTLSWRTYSIWYRFQLSRRTNFR